MGSNNSEDEYGQGMKDRQLAEQSSVQRSSQMSAVSFVLIPPTPSSCPRSQPNNTHLSPSRVPGSKRKYTGRGLEEENKYHERDLRKPTEDEITGLQVLGEKESTNNNV